MEPTATASVVEQDKEEAYAAKEASSRPPPGSSSPPPGSSSPPPGSSSPPPGYSSYRQGASKRKRNMRNTDILVEWIRDHPHPYPDRPTKVYLTCKANMTMKQLNDWFSNARRDIKKNGISNWLRKRQGGVGPPNYLVTNQAVHGIDSRGRTATTPVTPAFGSLSAVPPTPAGLHQNSYGMPPAACNCAHGQQSSPTYSHFTFATNHLP